MKLDDAIKTALEYETGIHSIYLEAIDKTSDAIARRIFTALCREEQGHLEYLRSCLEEWQKTGKIRARQLKTSIPAREAIQKHLQDLQKTVQPKPTRQLRELETLKQALDAEIKTGNFYKDMVRALDGEGQELFKRFVAIEDGHAALVQAELDSVGNWGFWFDTPEFRLEME